MIETSAAM